MRRDALRRLAARIAAVALGRPVRVAIDGRTASGKTTLAAELGEAVAALGRPVIRTSIDGFHRPRAERYARGRLSAEGYYHDGRDLAAVRRLLLDPLGPGGDRRYRTLAFDLVRDEPVDQAPMEAAEDAVLIVDGTFLQRPELRDAWDLVVFVAVDAQVALARGLARDAGPLGDQAEAVYRQRYLPAFDLYEALVDPLASADAVVGNDDFDDPTLDFQVGGRLSGARPA